MAREPSVCRYSKLSAGDPALCVAMRRGFSLVEAVAVIAVVTVLLALVAPSLLRSSASARDLDAVSKCAQHTQVLMLYRGDYLDVFPFLTDPSGATVSVQCCGFDAVEATYFDAAYYWNISLADTYYDGDCMSMFHARHQPGTRWNAWRYPLAFITRPEYWNQSLRLSPPQQFRPTFGSDVSFPSTKASVVEVLLEGHTGRSAVGFCDGRAARLSTLSPTDPALDVSPTGTFPTWERAVHWQSTFGVTRDGVRGRDVR